MVGTKLSFDVEHYGDWKFQKEEEIEYKPVWQMVSERKHIFVVFSQILNNVLLL